MSGLLQDLIADRALARPEALAVPSEGAPLSYGELDPGSNRLARMLRDLGCRRGWLRREGAWTLIHSRHGDIVAAMERGAAGLSRLDGEWWLRFIGG